MIVLKKSKFLFSGLVVISLIVGILIYFLINTEYGNDEADNLFPVNSKGQTYGTALDYGMDNLPDLIYSVGKHDTKAYITKADFLRETQDNYETYTLAVSGAELDAVRKSKKNEYENADELDFYRICYDVPMYDENGDMIDDSFRFTVGIFPYQSQLH